MKLRRYPSGVKQHEPTLTFDVISPFFSFRHVFPSVAACPPLLFFAILRIILPSFLLSRRHILISLLLFASSLVIVEGFEHLIPFVMMSRVFRAVKKTAHILMVVPRRSLMPVGHVLRPMQVVRVLGLGGRLLSIVRLLLHLLKELPILVFRTMGSLLVVKILCIRDVVFKRFNRIVSLGLVMLNHLG